ncbi:hypothetical protein Nepgr_024572 [Nepenthes gracilis]|uniref:Uncharacterized protein n=1 Tax=Nepenthes gracilis TaxID=150966 RepID=A0AAD3T5F8_NEPGR|nr:hypothetical protein Nepgr_024572 [Nepenthes gracilis]
MDRVVALSTKVPSGMGLVAIKSAKLGMTQVVLVPSNSPQEQAFRYDALGVTVKETVDSNAWIRMLNVGLGCRRHLRPGQWTLAWMALPLGLDYG